MVSDIAKRRRILGLTQEYVSNKSEITQEQVAWLENSSQIPRSDTLTKVTIALGMNVQLKEIGEQTAGNQLARV